MQDFTDQLQAYFKTGELQTYGKNQTITVKTQAVQQVYYVVSGYVRVFGCNNRGEEFTHIMYGPGDVYPLSWMANIPMHEVFAEAMTPVQIYAVGTAQLQTDIPKDISLACGLLQRTIDQYHNYALRVINLEYKYASERLGGHLLALASYFGQNSSAGVTIIPPLTQRVLGASINLSRESTSREMEKLLRRKLIAYNAKRQVIIPDTAALAKYLQLPFGEAGQS